MLSIAPYVLVRVLPSLLWGGVGGGVTFNPGGSAPLSFRRGVGGEVLDIGAGGEVSTNVISHHDQRQE